MTPNLSSLLKGICLEHGLTQKSAKLITQSLAIELQWRILSHNRSIRWPDFGTFYPKHRKAGRALDQSTKTWRPVKAQVTVGFKPAKASKAKL